jgi:hypothetical protein
MKEYEVRFQHISDKGLLIYTTKKLHAKNIDEVFKTIKKDFPRSAILWILEWIEFWKRPCRYNAHYYTDRKTGLLLKPKPKSIVKMNLDMNSTKLKSDFVKIRLQFLKLYRRYTSFSYYRSKVEKYSIKNGFLDVASAINSTRTTSQVQLARQKALFDLKAHLQHSDPSGKTMGCGCKYCLLLYYSKRYQMLSNYAGTLLIKHRGLKDNPLAPVMAPVIPRAEYRLILWETRMLDKHRKYDKLAHNVKVLLDIPKISYNG